MPDIRPISELRLNLSAVERDAHATDRPIFFTNNGKASLVLLSNKAYDAICAPMRRPPDPTLAGRLIEIIRRARGIDPGLFRARCEAAGVPARRLERVLDGTIPPGKAQLDAICGALGADPGSVRDICSLDEPLRSSVFACLGGALGADPEGGGTP